MNHYDATHVLLQMLPFGSWLLRVLFNFQAALYHKIFFVDFSLFIIWYRLICSLFYTTANQLS
jgi:hypothetical protein